MAGQGIAALRDVRALTAVFDRDRYGLDVEVGIWYFAAQMLTTFTWMIAPLVQGQGVGWNPWPYYLLMVVINAVEGAALVAVLHAVREVGPLLAAWGGVSVVVGAAFRGVIGMLAFEGWTVRPPLEPLMLGSSFVYGALFVLGLVVGVRQLGVVPSAFVGGAAAGSALHSLLFQIAWSVTQEGGSFSWSDPISSAINGAIVGGLVYVGLARHMKRRGVTAGPMAERPGAAPAASAPATATATPGTAAVAASSPGSRQHYFVCCGSPAPIEASMEAYRVAVAAGWGQFRRLRAAVQGGRFEDARKRAAEAGTSFPGSEFMGEQSWATSTLEKVLAQIRAAESEGSVHVAYGATDSRRVEWMQTVYRRLVGEALKQGIPPFRMYVTESDAAAAALVEALEEA